MIMERLRNERNWNLVSQRKVLPYRIELYLTYIGSDGNWSFVRQMTDDFVRDQKVIIKIGSMRLLMITTQMADSTNFKMLYSALSWVLSMF